MNRTEGKIQIKFSRNLLHAAVVAFLLVSTGAFAQDYDAGMAAYEAGDFETAFNELHPFAKQGDAKAQFRVGAMYHFGDGVSQNFTKAENWYRLAAEKGNVDAFFNLGAMYEERQDYTEAVQWYRRAAERGDVDAQFNLGSMYETGAGVPLDLVSAYMWWDIATANGDNEARQWRDVLSKHMTRADISKGQRRARMCIASGFEDCGR